MCVCIQYSHTYAPEVPYELHLGWRMLVGRVRLETYACGIPQIVLYHVCKAILERKIHCRYTDSQLVFAFVCVNL